MIRIGLTGSIGMGKTVSGRFFKALGIPVHDSDAAVHRLYQGPVVASIRSLFPDAIAKGIVDRRRLGELALNDPKAMNRLESLIHPLVEQDREDFCERRRRQGYFAAVFDIPLLFETGGERKVDVIAVVYAEESVQKERALSRSGMTEEKFQAIMARQLPSEEKLRRAHAVLRSDRGLNAMRRQVESFVRSLSSANFA